MMSMLLVWGAPMRAEENLLPNGSFEAYTSNAFGYSFEDWSYPLGCGFAETEDKLDGEVSFLLDAAFESMLDNECRLTDETYAAGSLFKITMHYKVLALPQETSLQLDCYWEPEAGADADAMRAHDADKLQAMLTDVVSSEWKTLEIITSKPAHSAGIRVRVNVPKKAKVLFDDMRVEQTESEEPYILVTPSDLSSISTTFGIAVDFPTLHIQQGHITGTTTFELSGYDADMFRLSATSIPEGKEEFDLIVTYAPTESGTHTALLNIDNLNHTSLFRSIKLTGTCTNPAEHPTLRVEPTILTDFSALEGSDHWGKFTVTSRNCQDFVYLHVDHVKGAAFTIGSTMIGKTAVSEVDVRFAPLEAGEFESTVTVYSEGVEPVVVTLKGTGIKKDPSTIDWQTAFEWDESNPLTLMNETFDNVDHNKTVKLDRWQNVAPVDERPWWGFDEAKTSPVRGDGRYAKATAYQYGKDSTGIWESWLVTPPLDYKNAEGKIFTFCIMGEYMPDEGNETIMEIYYVDATGEEVYFQDMTENFVYPTTSDENNVWRTFFLNLEPYSETVADVFHIAFRYAGPNGGKGAVTYYLDNISWGRTDLPQIIVDPSYVIDSTAVAGVDKVIAEVNVTSKNLTDEILMGFTGANYRSFDLSVSSLPASGGTVSITFDGDEEGIHVAYLVFTSKGAPDRFIPIAVLCHAPTGLERIQDSGFRIQKIIRDGQVIIIRDGKEYNVLGTQL